MATAPGEFNVCEIIYLPLLTKYVRYEDDCAQCSESIQLSSLNCYSRISQVTDFSNGQNHIDIWTGSSTVNGGQNQINCEDNLTFGGQYSIVRNPPTNYGVNSKSGCSWTCLYSSLRIMNSCSSLCCT